MEDDKALNINQLKYGKHFCLMPWVHLHMNSQGRVQACCVGNIPFGNVNQSSLAEIWQGEAIRNFRMKMLKDEREPRCQVCYAREAAGATSIRQETLQKFEHLQERVAHTDEQGYAKDSPPVFWDLRFSNLCNFRCRTCWHGASSRWFEEAQTLGTTAGKMAVLQAHQNPDKFFADLASLLPHLEEVYFAGGEPLLMPEHFQLLEMLIQNGKTDVRLRYNTNFSRLNYGSQDLVALWSKFSNVTLGASLDAVGPRAELLRKEQNWATIRANREHLRKVAPGVNFEIHPTVSVFNVLRLPEWHREWVEQSWIGVNGIYLNLLERPPAYNIKVLSAEMRDEVRAVYGRHSSWLLNAGASPETQTAFREIVAFMEADDWSEKLGAFRQMTGRLDKMRGEKVREVFPELAPLWKNHK